MGCSFPKKLQALCLPFWWKWAPSLVFLEYLTYFNIYCVNGCFWGTTLSGCFIILITFHLTYMGVKGKFSGEHSSQMDF